MNFTWKIIARTPGRLAEEALNQPGLVIASAAKQSGSSDENGLPENWRDQLATRLGYRPRRIGILAELALYGALGCLDAAEENELPGDVLLRVCSMRGPVSAISHVIEQMREDLPLPFSFLQSQTSQILPALAGALNWQGDAGIVMTRNPMDLVTLACRQAGHCGMLLGWVEEENPCQSYWIRLAPCASPPSGFVAASSFDEMSSPGTNYWRLGKSGMEIAP